MVTRCLRANLDIWVLLIRSQRCVASYESNSGYAEITVYLVWNIAEGCLNHLVIEIDFRELLL